MEYHPAIPVMAVSIPRPRESPRPGDGYWLYEARSVASHDDMRYVVVMQAAQHGPLLYEHVSAYAVNVNVLAQGTVKLYRVRLPNRFTDREALMAWYWEQRVSKVVRPLVLDSMTYRQV